ncbi:solute carrier family 15 member 4-like [Stegodyphus dumicola]|uniref:solute carrier family 15 member 4-like n=1 Tax=Stegodyphus dumicola TaxID=202533 RepID=UPI0015B0840E|nr:solute carrier family 15 member 4-like [Stegodyphus dumicola]
MLFNVLFLIIFIPLMNQVIYPYLDKQGIKIGLLTRMAFGMVCATLSMFIAGGIEIWRLDFIHNKHTVNQTIENTLYVAADLSIFWQIPQYSLIGISEVFTSVSGMEFACSQAPSTMQSAVMGLYYFCAGIGSFIGVAAWGIFNRIIKPHMHSSNINYVELHYYFFALAVIQLLTLIVFCFISKNLKIRKPPAPNNSTTSSFLSSVSRGRV